MVGGEGASARDGPPAGDIEQRPEKQAGVSENSALNREAKGLDTKIILAFCDEQTCLEGQSQVKSDGMLRDS